MAPLGRALGAGMHVVHVYYPATLPPAADFSGASVVSISPEVLAVEQVLELTRIKALVAGSPVAGAQIHVMSRAPSQYLPSVAGECRIDLLIMGWHRRGRVTQAVIGNTAERVLSRACRAMCWWSGPRTGRRRCPSRRGWARR